MQRAGIQRSDNEFVKTLTMFTTQRFQNYGILADAVGDYKAQKRGTLPTRAPRTRPRYRAGRACAGRRQARWCRRRYLP